MKLLNYSSDNFWEHLDEHLSLRQLETSSKIEDDVKSIIDFTSSSIFELVSS